MQNRELSKKELVSTLAMIPEFDPGTVDEDFEEQPGKPGIHFFKVRYADDEIIVPKGIYSDYAGILLQGIVKVFDVATGESPLVPRLPSCWLRARPWLRRIVDWLHAKVPQNAAMWKWLRRLLRRREYDLANPLEKGRFAGSPLSSGPSPRCGEMGEYHVADVEFIHRGAAIRSSSSRRVTERGDCFERLQGWVVVKHYLRVGQNK